MEKDSLIRGTLREIEMKILLAAVLALAAELRAWGLQRNGTGTEYYSAAVRSMLENWHNFFYASFDPAGFVSVDKPRSPSGSRSQAHGSSVFMGSRCSAPRSWKAS